MPPELWHSVCISTRPGCLGCPGSVEWHGCATSSPAALGPLGSAKLLGPPGTPQADVASPGEASSFRAIRDPQHTTWHILAASCCATTKATGPASSSAVLVVPQPCASDSILNPSPLPSTLGKTEPPLQNPKPCECHFQPSIGRRLRTHPGLASTIGSHRPLAPTVAAGSRAQRAFTAGLSICVLCHNEPAQTHIQVVCVLSDSPASGPETW